MQDDVDGKILEFWPAKIDVLDHHLENMEGSEQQTGLLVRTEVVS